MPDLTTLGWDDVRAEQFAPYAAEGLVPGRVAVQHRGAYDVVTELGELRCDVRGRLYDESSSAADLPAVGDWVAVSPRPGEQAGTIEAVLPRRTRFSRKTAWQAAEEQVLAANVDVVFLVTSLNEDFDLRRLERYLTLARESGALPVVVLTKADLHADPASALAEAESVAMGVPVIAVSNVTGEGLDTVRSYLQPGVTAALLGSSGVGKSTLVNTLAGTELLATQTIRDDGKGRHTTVRRELILLPERRARDRHARDARAPAVGRGRGARGDVRGRDVAVRAVPLLRLRARREPGCAVKAGDRERLARSRAMDELPQARGGARASRAAPRPAGGRRGASPLEGDERRRAGGGAVEGERD